MTLTSDLLNLTANHVCCTFSETAASRS